MKKQDRMFSLVEAQDSSQMTVAAFCELHQLTAAKFYYWRRRWKNLLLPPNDLSNVSPLDAGFIQIQPDDLPTGLSLTLPNGGFITGAPKELALFYHHLRCLDPA